MRRREKFPGPILRLLTLLTTKSNLGSYSRTEPVVSVHILSSPPVRGPLFPRRGKRTKGSKLKTSFQPCDSAKFVLSQIFFFPNTCTCSNLKPDRPDCFLGYTLNQPNNKFPSRQAHSPAHVEFFYKLQNWNSIAVCGNAPLQPTINISSLDNNEHVMREWIKHNDNNKSPSMGWGAEVESRSAWLLTFVLLLWSSHALHSYGPHPASPAQACLTFAGCLRACTKRLGRLGNLFAATSWAHLYARTQFDKTYTSCHIFCIIHRQTLVHFCNPDISVRLRWVEVVDYVFFQ